MFQSLAQEGSRLQNANKKLVLMIFERGINKQDLTVFDEWYVDTVIDHSAFPGQAPGVVGLKNSVKELYEMLPDVRVKVEDIIAEGDLVATRETWTAKKRGSDKTISGSVIHFFKIKNGRVSEEWSKGWEWLNVEGN